MKFWNAFDAGRIRDALTGSVDLFVPGPTYRTHDRLLAVRQLLWWAADRDAWDQAAAGFLEAATSFDTCADAGQVFDLLWCYILVSRDAHEVLPIPTATLSELVRGVSERCRSEIDQDPTAQAQRAAVEEALAS